jgi:hypothetical protein
MRTLLAMLVLAGSVPLAAQGDPWQRQVDSALGRARVLAADRGFTSGGAQLTGELGADESERRTVALDANADYLILAVCDGDCRTLNLVLSNPNGDDVAVDRQAGNVPLLQWHPARRGEYQVRVIMRGCRVSPCRYGVAVFLRLTP